ncbi:hypothetical protein E4U42_006321 [Claviceps africana]|uniref:Uncharacterized protein n=1 Tax=Claviceps africana TaxID=83212 RepID=A0A8K0J8I3_9HYPO|nr:hypothetical protein E4U42_006321 [Claviceps africana]
MRFVLVLSALAGLALASPIQQGDNEQVQPLEATKSSDSKPPSRIVEAGAECTRGFSEATKSSGSPPSRVEEAEAACTAGLPADNCIKWCWHFLCRKCNGNLALAPPPPWQT